MNNSIESSKYFPYIAWITVVGFAFFTYSLTTRMQEQLADIGDGVERLEQKINEMGAQQEASTSPISTSKGE
ncbi:hypothetical protein IPH92_05065 [Candidatus Kaiserbacteria bacterium]|nr:MAG: hypothetical protein IPH92_05065 [Candidatus Kaiserbacteria bacterium]